MELIPAEIIKKKRRGLENSPEEIRFMVESYYNESLPESQMAAWAMCIFFQKQSSDERSIMTEAMKNSGYTFDFSDLSSPCIDKHSTGGVGDKASLILAPIAAAAGIPVPMIAGRGLGHTGGTLDKLEAIPNFKVYIEKELFIKSVKEHNLCIMGQTDDICPADKKLYSLRDVAGIVESEDLICSSIMSKKLAEGIKGLVLDVKFGSGAFMKTVEQSESLATKLKAIGEANGTKVTALLTNMEQPLGRFIGNALEIQESLEILMGKTFEVDGIDFYKEPRELSIELASHMILLGKKANSIEEAREIATETLTSGKALEKFKLICQIQGPSNAEDLPKAKHKLEVKASTDGYLHHVKTEQVGIAAIKLGAGRKISSDVLDPTAGIEVHKKLGMKINKGDTVYTIFANNDSSFTEVEKDLQNTVEIKSETYSDTIPLVAKILL